MIAQRKTLLAHIKEALYADAPYSDCIKSLAANNIDHTGTAEQVFRSVTDTFHLEPTTADTPSGPVPALIFMARPITDDREQNHHLKKVMQKAICGTARGYFYLRTNKVNLVDGTGDARARVDCKLCKSDIHRTLDCPLPNTRGWKGIVPANLGFKDEQGTSDAGPKKPDDPRAIMDAILGTMQGTSGGRGAGAGRGSTAARARGGPGTRSRGRGGRGGGRGRGQYRK